MLLTEFVARISPVVLSFVIVAVGLHIFASTRPCGCIKSVTKIVYLSAAYFHFWWTVTDRT